MSSFRLLCWLSVGVAYMPQAKRERRERTDNYHLLQQWCRTPEQRLYEGIRLVVLFGIPPSERAARSGNSPAMRRLTRRRSAARLSSAYMLRAGVFRQSLAIWMS